MDEPIRTTREDGGVPDEIDMAFHAVREQQKGYSDAEDLDVQTVAAMLAHCMKYADKFGVDFKRAMGEAKEIYDDWR